jgi:hypothetical protein
MAAGMAAISEFMARIATPPPPVGPTVVQPEPTVTAIEAVALSEDQEAWLRLVERYLKLRHPSFREVQIRLWQTSRRRMSTLFSVLWESTEFRGRGWRASV